jgi:hypothetical protein
MCSLHAKVINVAHPYSTSIDIPASFNLSGLVDLLVDSLVDSLLSPASSSYTVIVYI